MTEELKIIDKLATDNEKLRQQNKELVEILETAKQKLHRCNDPGTSTSILANEITELLNKVKQPNHQ